MTFSHITLSFLALFFSLSLQAGEPQLPLSQDGPSDSWYAMNAEGDIIYDVDPNAAFPMLVHEHVYPNIDLIIYRDGGIPVAYEYVVYPGGNPEHIRIDKDMLSMSSFATQNLAGVDPTPVALSWQSQAQGWKPLTGPYEKAQILSIRME
ncbi:MAG: hypothetical protein D6722_07435 [Bacteroidetes bacterium]|nr:MAG: hypothetical protein D6722_07435 [Bacteroidota bacterium]